jgi:hypothetical protein
VQYELEYVIPPKLFIGRAVEKLCKEGPITSSMDCNDCPTPLIAHPQFALGEDTTDHPTQYSFPLVILPEETIDHLILSTVPSLVCYGQARSILCGINGVCKHDKP